MCSCFNFFQSYIDLPCTCEIGIRKPSSRIVKNFLEIVPQVKLKLKSFLCKLFESPLRNPSSQGDGFVVTVEHCLGGKYLNLSPARPHYSRSDYGRHFCKNNVEFGPIDDGYGTNFFSLDESTFSNMQIGCIDCKKKYLCSYGTGVGTVSFGVSSMYVLRFFSN